jgi:DNA (cytosine-5)-methyltransferase 1
MSRYRLGSLFSGIGGLELGFEMTGEFETVFQVEIDPWARRVLSKHWPQVARYEDVRSVGRHNLPDVDVLVGGFPCQDLSLAGRGAGLAGERSGLWWEFHRLIGELRPRIAVLENVPGLLVRGMDDVLGGLAALGYDASWQVVSAASQGAPHIRDRVFIVAHTANHGPRRGQQQPTPTVNDSKNSTLPASQATRDGLPGELIREGVSGQLSPLFVEWLMGFPAGWTDLGD